VVAGAAYAATVGAIGDVTYALPAGCVSTTVNGITYYQCGSTWYQPTFMGTTITYVVVNPPQ
jgi:hypothetical protein